MTFDYYPLCFKFSQFDLFTEVYHTYIQCCAAARHCVLPAILPSMSLKNAPSAGLRGRPKKPADFSLFKPRFHI